MEAIKKLLAEGQDITMQQFEQMTSLKLLKKHSFRCDENDSIIYTIDYNNFVEVKNSKIIDIIEVI